jgi:hypothetical protein
MAWVDADQPPSDQPDSLMFGDGVDGDDLVKRGRSPPTGLTPVSHGGVSVDLAERHVPAYPARYAVQGIKGTQSSQQRRQFEILGGRRRRSTPFRPVVSPVSPVSFVRPP